MVRSSPTTRAPRFGESFASLDTPSAPSAPSLTLGRSTTNGPLDLSWLAGVSMVINLRTSCWLSDCPRLASLPFAVDWHRATDGFQYRATLFCTVGRCAGAPREDWKVQSVPTGRGQSIASVVSFPPVGFKATILTFRYLEPLFLWSLCFF